MKIIKRTLRFVSMLSASLMLVLCLGNNYSNADSDSGNDENIPTLTLSEAIRYQVKEAKISEFDVPGFEEAQKAVNKPLTNTLTRSASSKKGVWKYMYTAQPYAFYKNTKTGEIKVVQMTPYSQHLINVVTKGWADSVANNGGYFGSNRH